MATELENLIPEADVEVEGFRGPKGDKGDSYVLTEADKEEIAQKVDKIIDAETDKTLTLSGKPADAKAAGDAINDLKADLSDLTTSDSLKINKPETNPDGTNGQLLRTLGNGKTEWSDFAAPTDEQVEISVNAWLDEHPEATTTVEDWSLTENKFVKGALGFITPQMFGAKGDGTTDDTLAFQSAVDYAIQNSVELFVPSGVYMIFPSNGPVYLNHLTADGQGLVMRGAGRGKTIIKEGDGETAKMGRYTKMFYCDLAATSAVSALGDFIISDITFDKNARSNGTPGTLYAWEAAHVIAFQGNSNKTINSVRIEHVEFYDKIGGGIVLSASTVRVSLIIIKDVISINHPTIDSGIIGQRGDIECEIYSDLTIIKDCNVKYSQIELTDTYHYSLDAYIRYKITDSVFEVLEYDAQIVENPVINVEINNITCTKKMHLSGVVAQIENSVFVGDTYTTPKMFIDNCIILLPYTEETNEDTGTVTWKISPFYGFTTGTYPDCFYHISNSFFKINSVSITADVIDGDALKATLRTSAQTQVSFLVNNCVFDEAIPRVVDVYSNGGFFAFENCYFRKRTRTYNIPLFMIGSYSSFKTSLALKNCDFSGIQNGQIILQIQQATKNYELEIVGTYKAEIWKQSSNNPAAVQVEQYYSHPKIIGEQPVSGSIYFTGDIVLNKLIQDGGDFAWLCTNGGNPGTWKPLITLSS